MDKEPESRIPPGDDPLGKRNISWEMASGEGDDELFRAPSTELEEKARAFRETVEKQTKSRELETPQTSARKLLVSNVMGSASDKDQHEQGAGNHKAKKKGAFAGVFVPTCENMWGVLIFLRFHIIVGYAGVGQALLAVFLSFSCAYCTTSSMSATVSSGGIVSKGGPYYMISRALGPSVGASVGVMYWLANILLAVLEVLGAVEAFHEALPAAVFTQSIRAYGTALMILLVLFVRLGISFVSRLGVFFVFIVFSTLAMYYVGLIGTPLTDDAERNPWITGLDMDTMSTNWGPHYPEGKNFGYVLSVFFPCFTGILSGANRADVLRDPPTNLRDGTFGAIIFSLFMYSSYMILWGMVADYRYLQGEDYQDYQSRRLAGGTVGGDVVTDIVWNPFPKAALIGIIIASASQALQCLVVAPRLLQSIAKDEVLTFLNKLAPLSAKGEPVRALYASYVLAAMFVLIGNLDIVAPLLSMCFLVAYVFMNFSCFTLTWLRSTAWRPKGIHRKRWRLWYMCTSGCGVLIAVSIMFIINPFWAIGALFLAMCLYLYISMRKTQQSWGSALDGIRYQLALNSLIQLEASQNHHVNWRPQVLILYRIHLADELKGIKHHEILRFYSMLRKVTGFGVVACVLEADQRDEHAIKKARIEKDIIQSIMKEEGIQGFAEVVVAPSWSEGTNYVIQLTGIGGLSPNTVLLDWPVNWRKKEQQAFDFVDVVRTALSSDKAVLAVKGLRDLPSEPVYGTIDIWWMLHDGGFLILLSWILSQHRTWRKCHLRVFTVAEGVSAEKANAAAQTLTRTLRQRRLFDVDVEVIIADDVMLEPYTHDWTLRVEERHKFLEQLHPGEATHKHETIPLEIDDLFRMQSAEANGDTEPNASREEDCGTIVVSDVRAGATARSSKRASTSSSFCGAASERAGRKHSLSNDQGRISEEEEDGPNAALPTEEGRMQRDSHGGVVVSAVPLDQVPGTTSGPAGSVKSKDESVKETMSGDPTGRKMLAAMVGASEEDPLPRNISTASVPSALEGHKENMESFLKLNQIIYTRSKRAQLVVMNLPDLWGNEPEEVRKFMSYCDTLTKGLERVLFVHSTGHEIFDLSL